MLDSFKNQTKDNAPSILASQFRLKGDLDNNGDLQIDGQLEGTVNSVLLTIGTTGKVVGRVTSTDMVVYGTIEGQIRAKTISLQATANITGDIVYETIEIVTGAKMNGKLTQKPYQEEKKEIIFENGNDSLKDSAKKESKKSLKEGE